VSNRKSYLHRYPDGSINFRYQRKTLGRLPLPEGSDAFNAEYDRLLASVAGKAKKRGRPAAMIKPKSIGPTIGLFVARWKASDWFANENKPNLKEKPFAESTQRIYRIGLDAMHRHGLTEFPFSELTVQRAKMYIAKVKRESGGATAALHKALLSNLWQFASDFPDFDGGDRSNPVRGQRSTYTVMNERKPWPEDVQDRFLAACDQNVYDAFHLLICTGQRVSDVTKMKREDYDGTHFYLVQKKDRSKTPMRIKAPKVLRDILKARAARERQNGGIGHNSGEVSPFLLTHKWGGRYLPKTLTTRIREVLVSIGEPGYSTHGLRKNAGIMLAENGATVPQIMAALGHKTPKMALYYCRLANQNKLADQAADILDLAFAGREEGRQARIVKRRNGLKLID
jgi:integrase